MDLLNLAWTFEWMSLVTCFSIVRAMIGTTRRTVREQRERDIRALATAAEIPPTHYTNLLAAIADFVDEHYCHNSVSRLRSTQVIVAVVGIFSCVITAAGYWVDASLQGIAAPAANLSSLPTAAYLTGIVLAAGYTALTVMAGLVLECWPELFAIVFPTLPRK